MFAKLGFISMSAIHVVTPHGVRGAVISAALSWSPRRSDCVFIPAGTREAHVQSLHGSQIPLGVTLLSFVSFSTSFLRTPVCCNRSGLFLSFRVCVISFQITCKDQVLTPKFAICLYLAFKGPSQPFRLRTGKLSTLRLEALRM